MFLLCCCSSFELLVCVKMIENRVASAGQGDKRLVLVLNKVDLVPREVVEKVREERRAVCYAVLCAVLCCAVL